VARPQKQIHEIRFQEESEIYDEMLGMVGPAYRAFCSETGIDAATCDDGEGWSGNHENAPQDPIERLVFGMDQRCLGGKHVHAEQITKKRKRP
jgi:hypothetical protein